MKIHLVIGKDDGGAGLWGEYVSLHGVYTKLHLAKNRLEELNGELDERGYAIDKQDEDGFVDYTVYEYKIISVNSDEEIDEFLGGYVE